MRKLLKLFLSSSTCHITIPKITINIGIPIITTSIVLNWLVVTSYVVTVSPDLRIVILSSLSVKYDTAFNNTSLLLQNSIAYL